VQRAWEVLRATGTGLAAWQDSPGRPLVPLAGAMAVLVEAPPEVLTPRIEARFDAMLAAGALDEVRATLEAFDPARPAFRAIGAPELTAHLQDRLPLAEARLRAIVATRQYAKRQRTWFRKRMLGWTRVTLAR
jgi:tRNA dimethylallyltransferase